MNMTRKAWLVPVLAAAAVCWGSALAAQDKDEQEGNQAAVAKAVLGARVPLERGLAASASHGQPISAKFEMEGRTEPEGGDGQGEGVPSGSGGAGPTRQRRLSRSQRHTVVEGWPRRRRRRARKGRRAQDCFGAVEIGRASCRERV